MSHHNLALKACVLSLTLMSGVAAAQQPTPEEQAFIDHMMKNAAAMQQWGDVVHYRVVGEYKGAPNVSSDPNWMAFADVTDRVEFEFDWKLSEGTLVGAPKLQNFKSTLANPRNPEPKCAPPTIGGPYEHADLKAVATGIGSVVDLKWETSHPPVGAPQFCTGTPKKVPPAQRMTTYQLPVVAPTLLSMPLPASGDVTLSKDGKSFIHRKNNWTWTFTPTNK